MIDNELENKKIII